MRSRSFMLKKWTIINVAVIAGLLMIAGLARIAAAAEPPSDFSLQVTPSPLVTTLKPGTTTELELKIRNAGTGTEELKIEPKRFTIDKKTGQINLDDVNPAEIAPWISYSAPRFSVKSGDWFTQKVRIALPKDTGFSYSLAMVISRTNNPTIKNESGRVIKGSLAIFTLINVDRPGATRKLEVTDFTSTQSLYEYLPAQLNISFKNTGNSIIQPYGNVFIQRSSGDTTPIATLPVNDKEGYILPGNERTLNTEWSNGFPLFKVTSSDDGSKKTTEIWDWSKLTDFRIGPYTAKLVAIYNDGQRDVPIEREITFWVIPWRSILAIILVISVILFVRHKQIERKTRRAVKRALVEHDKKKDVPDAK